MKRIIAIWVAIGITTAILAQAPEIVSYQVIIRDASNSLVCNQVVGMRISVLEDSAEGKSVYVETQTPVTNVNGLASVQIGEGTLVSGSFSSIDWADGPYFLKTEIDPEGDTHYILTGSNQVLSVPYALHANTADSLTGSLAETDPLFVASVAYAISASDTAIWNNKQDKLTAGTGIVLDGNTISTTSSGATGFIHYIGEEYGGGVIFHLWKDSEGTEHGLVVSTTYQGIAQAWGNIGTIQIGAAAQSSWDGLSNSTAIVAQDGHTSSAAKLCLDWVSGAYSDWYLPSLDELSLLWHNRFNVNKTLTNISGASLLPVAAYYWSSTEVNSDFAWYFDYGFANFKSKASTYYVRAVRRF